jgi:hypothetical protein
VGRLSVLRPTVMPMTEDPHPWLQPFPPASGSEADTLLGSLERQRATFAWKCGGLDRAGLAATVGASTLTLGGLLKHLAFVEHLKFSTMLHGRDLVAPWDTVDWGTDPDWPWRSAAEDTPEALYALWRDAVTRARAAVRDALSEGDLGHRVVYVLDDGAERPSLRCLLAEMVEEYARHVGHADLIREAVDGLVGEDPPSPVAPYPPLGP